MASGSVVPRDLHDGIRDALGKRIKIALMRKIKLEIKQDKIEEKVIVLSACRMFVMTVKGPKSQIESTFHYLDIQSIESKKQNQLRLVVHVDSKDSKMYNFQTMEAETDDVNHIITHIGTALKAIFPLVPLEKIIKQVEVIPHDRISVMYNMIKDIEGKDAGPCGGYSHMYACMCDYYGLRFQDEVAWDVDTIYLSHDSKELCLGDFDHLDSRNLIPIIAALEYNPWFTSLKASGTKLNPESASKILSVVKKNTTIEELYLSGTGVGREFAEKLNIALLSNSNSLLSVMDMSNNVLEDRGISHLSGPVSHLTKGLTKLNLSKTSMTGKGANKLSEAITQNKYIPTTLEVLDLSGNALTRGEEPTNLFNFLAQPNALTTLNLSSTNIALDVIIAPLLRGCCQHLSCLDLSQNAFTNKKVSEVPQTWKQFFSTALSLKTVNLAGNKLPAEAVKCLLLGVASNKHIMQLELNLSENELKAAGAQVIGSCIAEIPNIVSLDISDNGFDAELVNILPWVSKNKVLKHLAIGKNFAGLKPRFLIQVLDTVVEMIQDDDCHLQSLSLADSKLKSEATIVIGALGSNNTLTHIDISGNYIGDFGARVLAKALMINTKLREIYWDKNGTSVQGFEDMAAALEKNFIVRKMPTPIHDAADALKSQPERTRNALEKIETLLHRNHSPRKFATEQAYRLQQGFLISATQQMVDRLVVQVQDTINALSMHPKNDDGDNDLKKDVEQAHKFVSDADNSKQLLPKLQQVALKSETTGNLIEAKLKIMAQDLWVVLEEQLKKNVRDMLLCAEERCPAVTGEEDKKSKSQEVCDEKSALPSNFTKDLILEQIGTDVMNKVSEINLSVATYISDEVNDGVLESLSKSHKTLTNHLNILRKRESDIKKREDGKSGDPSDNVDTEKKSQEIILRSPEIEEKEKTAMQDKRRSVYNRRNRPQSCVGDLSAHKVVDIDIEDGQPKKSILSEEDETLTVLSPSPSIDENKDESIKDNVDGNTPSASSSAKTPSKQTIAASRPISEFEELGQVHVLECVSKNRPKMKKTVRPTRPRNQETEIVDEGMDAFYGNMSASIQQEVTYVEPSRETKKKQEKVEASVKEDVKPITKEEVPVAQTTDKGSKKEKVKGGWSPFGGGSSLKDGISGFFNKSKKKDQPTKSESPPKPGKRARKEVDKKSESIKQEKAVEKQQVEKKVEAAVAKNEKDEIDAVEVRQAPTVDIKPENFEDTEEMDKDTEQTNEPESEVKEITPRKPMGVGMPGMGVPISMDMLLAKKATMKQGGSKNQEEPGIEKKALVPPPGRQKSLEPIKQQKTEHESLEPAPAQVKAPAHNPLSAILKPLPQESAKSDTSEAVAPRPPSEIMMPPESQIAATAPRPPSELVKPPESQTAPKPPSEIMKPPETQTVASVSRPPSKTMKPPEAQAQTVQQKPVELVFVTEGSAPAPLKKAVAVPRQSGAPESLPKSNNDNRPPPPTKPKPPPPTKPKPKPATKPRTSVGPPVDQTLTLSEDKSGVVRPGNRQSVKEMKDLLDSVDKSAAGDAKSSSLPRSASPADIKGNASPRPVSAYSAHPKTSLDQFKKIQKEVQEENKDISAKSCLADVNLPDSIADLKKDDTKIEPQENISAEVKSEETANNSKMDSSVTPVNEKDIEVEVEKKDSEDKSSDDNDFVVVDATESTDNENEEIVMV